MKYIIIGNIILSTLFFSSCKTQDIQKHVMDEVVSIERYESSRRTSSFIKVTAKEILSLTNSTDTLRRQVAPKQWKKITGTIATINLNEIEKIEAPSNSFTFDGAPYVALQFKTKDSIYYANPYDKGRPPAPYVELEDLLLSLLSE